MDTELQRLEAERDAALGRVAEMASAHEAFLRTITHDLRAPLRHVTSYAVLLREVLGELADPPAQVQEALGFAATMEQSARRMAAMIDGLHGLYRAMRAPLQLAPVDLLASIDQARAELAEADRVRWDVATPLPAVQADAQWLVQLLREVLGNAVKFSRGAADAAVTVRASTPSADWVRLSIADHGVGFDDARAQGLFGVFQRMHSERDFDGLGMGLALCKTIAERHGARIAAAAQPGTGCTITLDWPAA